MPDWGQLVAAGGTGGRGREVGGGRYQTLLSDFEKTEETIRQHSESLLRSRSGEGGERRRTRR